MPTTPPTLTDAPASPDRADRATFSPRAIALDDFTKNTQIPEARLMLANVYANAVEAADSATAAAASAATVTATTNVTKWISGTTYAQGVATWSPINFATYRRSIAGAGAIDPSADATNWSQILPLPSQAGKAGRGLVTNGTAASWGEAGVKGADIASAATINLTTATGDFVHVTGAVTITAITIPVGAERTVIFDGALTLTNGAALLLPSAANIVTAAGDRMIVRGDTAGAIVVSYNRASGQGLFLSSVTPLAAATISSPVATIDYLTLFSSAFDKYTIELNGIMTSALGNPAIAFAVAGTVDASVLYTNCVGGEATGGASTGSCQLLLNLPVTANGLNLTLDVRNANGVTAKSVGARGGYVDGSATTSVSREGFYRGASAVSGFRLQFNNGATFTGGTIRVCGHRNT